MDERQKKALMLALVYHGCFTKNADGTNKLIGPEEKSLIPAAQCFCEDPEDVRSGVKTCSQPAVSTEDYQYYFQEKQRIQRWISNTENSTTRESD